MRKMEGYAPEGRRKNQALSRRAEKSMAKG